MGYFQRLPDGIYSPQGTFHNALHFSEKFKMHSATVKTNGFEFLDSMANSHRHTDYRFQICSKMFVEAQRDKGGKRLIMVLWDSILIYV